MRHGLWTACSLSQKQQPTVHALEAMGFCSPACGLRSQSYPCALGTAEQCTGSDLWLAQPLSMCMSKPTQCHLNLRAFAAHGLPGQWCLHARTRNSTWSSGLFQPFGLPHLAQHAQANAPTVPVMEALWLGLHQSCAGHTKHAIALVTS
jgi:hypothetical protein